MKQEIFLTKEGLISAEDELGELIEYRNTEVIPLLKTTRQQTWNTEYMQVEAERDVLERRIDDLRVLINRATIIEKADTNKVSIGTKVKLSFLQDNIVETYSIVGVPETNPFENKISHEAPIAKAILGRKVDDIVSIMRGPKEYQVKILGITA